MPTGAGSKVIVAGFGRSKPLMDFGCHCDTPLRGFDNSVPLIQSNVETPFMGVRDVRDTTRGFDLRNWATLVDPNNLNIFPGYVDERTPLLHRESVARDSGHESLGQLRKLWESIGLGSASING